MNMYWSNMPQCNLGYKKIMLNSAETNEQDKPCSALIVEQEEGFVTSKHVRKPEIIFFTFEKLIIIFIFLFS